MIKYLPSFLKSSLVNMKKRAETRLKTTLRSDRDFSENSRRPFQSKIRSLDYRFGILIRELLV